MVGLIGRLCLRRSFSPSSDVYEVVGVAPLQDSWSVLLLQPKQGILSYAPYYDVQLIDSAPNAAATVPFISPVVVDEAPSESPFVASFAYEEDESPTLPKRRGRPKGLKVVKE